MEDILYIRFKNRELFGAHKENPEDTRVEDRELIKRVELKYLEKNFESLVDYMLKPDADNLNKAYNDEQTMEAERLRVSVADSKVPPSLTTVYWDATTKDNKELQINLEDKLEAYKEAIILSKQVEDDSGTKEYKEISIIYMVDDSSGV